MTAVLENVNPYSKYGLKRRPTYDEIANLISENETLTGTLPDRRATRFKASPEGSFFDGMDSLEILKEQQHRIMERQMRELLMRQNLGGGTFSIARLQQQRSENVQPEPVVHRDRNLRDVAIQTELEETARRTEEREQQTGEAHRQGGFLGNAVGGATSVIGGIMSGVGGVLNRATSSTSTPAMPATPKAKPAPPPKETPEDIDISTDAENRASNEPFKLSNSLKVNMMNLEKLKIQLFLRGIEVHPDEDIQILRDLANQMIKDGKWKKNLSTGQVAKKEKAYQEYKNKNIARGSRD